MEYIVATCTKRNLENFLNSIEELFHNAILKNLSGDTYNISSIFENIHMDDYGTITLTVVIKCRLDYVLKEEIMKLS